MNTVEYRESFFRGDLWFDFIVTSIENATLNK